MAKRRQYLIRNLDDGEYLETFLVSAVAAILLVRFYLYLTGFPQMGGKGLHIAHMLWGGLLMVVAIVMLFSYLDHHAHRLAAGIGGAGFGLFIDELGKFITSDNNYFFQPTTSLIYIVFILMYLVFQLLQHERHVTEREYLLNSLESFKEAVMHGFDRRHVERARAHLAHNSADDPIVLALHDLLSRCPAPAPQHTTPFQRLKASIHERYMDVVCERWFAPIVVSFFVVQALINFGIATFATLAVAKLTVPADFHHPTRLLEKGGDLLFAAVACALVLAGALLIVQSWMSAYRLFRTAVLVNIFLTEVFEFYDIQFAALYGLAVSLVGLAIVNTMIAQERVRSQHTTSLSTGADGEQQLAAAALSSPPRQDS